MVRAHACTTVSNASAHPQGASARHAGPSQQRQRPLLCVPPGRCAPQSPLPAHACPCPWPRCARSRALRPTVASASAHAAQVWSAPDRANPTHNHTRTCPCRWPRPRGTPPQSPQTWCRRARRPASTWNQEARATPRRVTHVQGESPTPVERAAQPSTSAATHVQDVEDGLLDLGDEVGGHVDARTQVPAPGTAMEAVETQVVAKGASAAPQAGHTAVRKARTCAWAA